jgi:hypothetical protein
MATPCAIMSVLGEAMLPSTEAKVASGKRSTHNDTACY